MFTNTHWLYRCAIIAGIILTTNLMSAQRTSKVSDVQEQPFLDRTIQLLSAEVGKESADFAKEYGLLDSINLSEIIPFLNIGKEEKDTTINKNPTFKFNNGFVGIQSNYSDLGNSENPFNRSGMYTKIAAGGIVQVMNVPLNVSGRIILEEDQYNPQLSNFKIDFNPARFLEQQKQNLLNKKGNRLLSMTSGKEALKSNIKRRTENLTAREVEILKKEIKFQLLQSIISSPNYADLLAAKDKEQAKLRNSQDSLQNIKQHIDSIYHAVQTSTSGAKAEVIAEYEKLRNTDQRVIIARIQDSLQTQLNVVDSLQAQVKTIQDQYQNSWNERKVYYGDSLQIIKRKVNEYVDLDPQQEARLISKEMLQTDSLPLLLKIASLTKKFQLGQSAVDGDWFSIQNLPIKGIQYGGGLGKWEAYFAIGKQVYNTAFTTIWNADFFTKAKGANVNYGSLVYTPDSTLSITMGYLSMKNKGFTDGPFLEIPFDNNVLSFRTKLDITKQLSLSTSFNFSNEISQSAFEDPSAQPLETSGFAGEITIGTEIFKGVTTDIGYFKIDENYISRGNPFIQPNRNGLVFKLKGTVPDKMDFGVDLKYGTSIDTSARLADNQNNFELLGYANYTVNPNWMVSAQVSPNTFKYFGSGDVNYSGSNSIYNLQITHQKELGTIQSISTVGFTNFNSEIQYVDTAQVNVSDQLFVQNALQLNQKSSISTLYMYGLNSGNNTEDVVEAVSSSFVQVDYAYQTESIGFSIGAQYLNNYTVEGTLWGITQGIHWRFADRLVLESNMNYQRSFKNSNESRLLASLSLKMEL